VTLALFRVDASSRIGTGHVMRCLTLAEALRARGTRVRFVCRDHEGHLGALIRHRAFAVTLLPVSMSTSGGEEYPAWLGATPETDAAQTIAALAERPDWLVVDHYGIGREWEALLRPHVGRILAIDDVANRPHDCDVLLDQNYSAAGDERYATLVPGGCKLLTGPRYALLSPVYAVHRKALAPRQLPPRRVLLFFGGADPADATGMALEALSAGTLRELEVDVVIGHNYADRSALRARAKARPRTTVHEPRPHLADLMTRADIAIGAGGVTTWERMCLGLPTVLVSIADNQRPACEALASAGLAQYAGHYPGINAKALANVVQAWLREPAAVAAQGARVQTIVDGLGVGRVAEVLLPSPFAETRLRPDLEVGFEELLLDASDIPLGRVQWDQAADTAWLDWALDPVAQGRDWDAPLVARALEIAREVSGRAGYFALRNSRPQALKSIVVLSDASSWMNEHIPNLLLRWLRAGHRVLWTHEQLEVPSGDFCFLLGCSQIVPPTTLARFRNTLVVHESDLPHGRGWSPMTWQILQGASRIPVTLIEATGQVDAGPIYAQEWVTFEGHELIGELRAAIGRAAIDLCARFVSEYPTILDHATPQNGEATFYARRTPSDSRLDTGRTLASQFDLLRVVDALRYPGFFEFRGQRYLIEIRKATKP
jgi:UDP-2,4-diacetamido-2,4,6-trideoxy-beta-L-altropyranose hydrolase